MSYNVYRNKKEWKKVIQKLPKTFSSCILIIEAKKGAVHMDKDQIKLQINFPQEVIEGLEEIGKSMGIKRTDVVKIAVKKYVDENRKIN